MEPVLYIVLPCYNEETVLPQTVPLFLRVLQEMILSGKVAEKSRLLLVDDGSTDATYSVISAFAGRESCVAGLSLSRNFSHQNALLAGMMTAKDRCDICITADCDGQDDPAVIPQMVEAYLQGNDIVYGVRCDRSSDTAFKRHTARGFYKLMDRLGAAAVPDHADFRLVSGKVLQTLESYTEVNLFLRGLFPAMGYKSTSVLYTRAKRVGGKTHYSVKRMIHLAIDGITGFSVKPLRLVSALGFLVTALSLVGIVWSVVRYFFGPVVSGWASIICIICFLGGIQLLSLGIIGEYVGRIYLETKGRPRYIIDRTVGFGDEQKM